MVILRTVHWKVIWGAQNGSSYSENTHLEALFLSVLHSSPSFPLSAVSTLIQEERLILSRSVAHQTQTVPALPNHHHREGLDVCACAPVHVCWIVRVSWDIRFADTDFFHTYLWCDSLSLPPFHTLSTLLYWNIFSIHENINEIAFKNIKKGNKYSEIKCKWTSVNCFLAFLRLKQDLSGACSCKIYWHDAMVLWMVARAFLLFIYLTIGY